jgi:hypothetical protein
VVVQQIRLAAPDQLDELASLAAIDPQWLLVFASPTWFTHAPFFVTLRRLFPHARLSGCSTAGEITRDGVGTDSCVVTALRWAAPQPAIATTELSTTDDSLAAGMRLGTQLRAAAGVVVFAPGVNINGSALIEGLAATLPPATPIVGGLAGDNGAFRQTYTLSDAGISSRTVVAIGLPTEICVDHGSFGGWQPFGPARKVTQSSGSVLYQLDGEPALTAYQRAIGEHARNLPASGLMFPFEMLSGDHSQTGVIRTIHGINEADGSLLLTGDIDPRGYLRLMHADNDALIAGSGVAAAAALGSAGRCHSLALLISCVGRKLVMGDRVAEEVAAAVAVLDSTTIAGFYSYGEFSPLTTGGTCRLHNQTMTITCLSEAP